MKLLSLTLRDIEDIEDANTQLLFQEFKSINKQESLSKDQFLKIAQWKSSRPLQHYKSNSEEEIRAVTSLAFATEKDSLKIHILTALKGVSYPTASAILMFYDQTKYPVLDIRVWQQLHQAGLVTTNARGQNFTLKQVEEYFEVIRKLSAALNLTARQVEKRLFDYDKATRLRSFIRSSNGQWTCLCRDGRHDKKSG